MVPQFDSKSSAFSASTISNSTSEHTSSNNSNHSALDDAFGLSFVNGQQLLEDLAIIDDLYAIYGQEESDCFGKMKKNWPMNIILPDLVYA